MRTTVRIGLLAVGRLRAGPIRTLFQDYARRIKWPLTTREVEERRPLAPSRLKSREGQLLLEALESIGGRSSNFVTVALDQCGTSLTSAAFAERLDEWRDGGRNPVFMIGGADGLDRAVLERADFTLSLGAMTWPHLMARVLLAEQLYRAQSILAGHPYHRE